MSQNQKICPFMSTPDKAVMCTPDCKLFRNNRPGYECYFQEIQAISWHTKQAATGTGGAQRTSARNPDHPPGFTPRGNY